MFPSPIITEVFKELKAPWLFSRSEQKLGKCIGHIPREHNRRCTKDAPQHKDTDKKKRIEELLMKLETIQGSTDNANDELLRLLEEFIELTHCWHHRPGALKKFKDVWAEHKQRAHPSQSLHRRALSSRSSESDNRSEEDTFDIYDVPENARSDSQKVGPDLSDDEDNTTQQIPDLEPEKEGSFHVATTELDEDNSTIQVAQSVSMLNIEDESDDVDPANFEPPPIESNDASGRVVEINVVNKFIKLGIVEIHRAGSLRDSSPVYHEMHKPLTGQDMSMGIVYILRQKCYDDLFKIGWTTFTAAERQRHHNNCYSINSTVIYESSAQFQAAHRAERLCHTILRHKKVKVKECKYCGGGHKEWFTISEEEVRRTVGIIEALVRLPGYVLLDGKMRLSPQAYVLIEGMSKFNLDKLGDSLRASDQDSLASENTCVPPTETLPDAAVIAHSPDQSLASIEQESFPETAPPPGANTATTVRLGAKFGKAARNIKGLWENWTRPSLPEEADGGGRRLSKETLKKKAIAQKDAFQKGVNMFLQDFETEYKKEV